MATTNIDLVTLGAKIVIEGDTAFIETFDNQRFKVGTVVSFDPLTIETKFEPFDLSGNTPPKAIDLEV